MKHPNAILLETIYAHLSSGNIKAALVACADSMTFQIPGKSPLAGKYSKSTFESELWPKIQSLSSGTFKNEIHDILASDLHSAVLGTQQVTVNAKKTEYRSVHVWRFENGKPVAWYEYPRDLYQFDTTWT